MLEIELHGFENTQRVHVTTSLVFNVIKASTIDDCRQQTEILSSSLRFQAGRDHEENTRHVIKAPKISFGNSRLLKKFVQFLLPKFLISLRMKAIQQTGPPSDFFPKSV